MIIDSSFVISLLEKADVNHERSLRWIQVVENRRQNDFHAPEILRVEVAASFRRRNQPIPMEWVEASVALHEVPSEAAEAMAREVGLRAGDAYFAALAAKLGQPLVTFDADQAERARAAGIEVQVPQP